MKVEATWRGPGRLELLLTGVQPADADRILESMGAAGPDQFRDATEMMAGPVGWAMGWSGSVLTPPVFHRWEGSRMSACHRWRCEQASGPFRPFLEDEQACRGCAA